MRDPTRIDAMLAALRETWLESPDLRLGQLIVNAVRPSAPCPEVFYVEDEELTRRLNGYRELVQATPAHKESGSG